tara:strand:+ start:117 stop:1922 length:1806 start_codon:yes stop_codon:yes gene_type:complete
MATKTYKVVIDVDSGDVKQLEKQLQGVSSEIKEIDQEVGGLTMDDKFKAAAGSVKVMAGALAGAVGTLGLFGVESEVFGEFEKKAASAIAVAIGFRDVAEGLYEMRTALKGVTAAQLKANAAALLNPYVAVAAAVVALTVAFGKYASMATDDVVPVTTSLKNMFLSLGSATKFAALQAKSYVENIEKLEKAAAVLALERSIGVLKEFGEATIDLEIQLQERKLDALEEGSEEYDDAFTNLLVLRAKKARGLMDEEAKAAEEGAKKKADAEIAAYNARLEEIRFDELLDTYREQDEKLFSLLGDEAAMTFTAAFNKVVKDEVKFMDPEWVDEDFEEVEDALFGNDGLITNYQNGLQEAVDRTIGNRESWNNFIGLASEAFANIESLSQQGYDRTLVNLERERNEIINNTALTEEAKAQSLDRISQKEKAVEIRRIKAERDQFTLKQTLLIAEQIMKAKSFAMEQIQIARLNVAKASATAQEIALAGTAAIGKASMSLGSFVAALGPFGIAAFAVSIGGIIASIVSARKKAKASIAAIGAPTGGGDSGGVSIPSMPSTGMGQDTQAPGNDVCATPLVRAYVLSGDARNAQEADAKLAARRTLG